MSLAILGCGYVGSALARRLVSGPRAARRILATTTRAERISELRALGVEPVRVELAQERRLHDLLGPCELVYLLVAAGAERSHREVYLEGVQHLLAAVRGTSVRRIVYTSSTGVYGQDDGGWVDEESPTRPRSENGKILAAAESRLLREGEAAGLGIAVLRLAGLHGPGRGPQNVLDRIAGSERDDAESWINLVHRDDVAEALARLVDIPYHGILNLADGHPTRRRDYYDPLLAAAGLPPVRWVSRAEPRPRGRRIANARARAVLGLAFRSRSLRGAEAPE